MNLHDAESSLAKLNDSLEQRLKPDPAMGFISITATCLSLSEGRALASALLEIVGAVKLLQRQMMDVQQRTR